MITVQVSVHARRLPIVLANKPGRLGNRLIQAAHVLAFAREHSLPLVNVAMDEYASWFEGTRLDLLAGYPPRFLPVPPPRAIRRSLFWSTYRLISVLRRVDRGGRVAKIVHIDWDESCWLPRDLLPVVTRTQKFIFLQGWQFQDPDDLRRHGSYIRAYFRPARPHDQRIRETVGAVRRSLRTDVLVGVHIRHGDLRGTPDFFSRSEYRLVMRAIEKAFEPRSVGFLIVSDQAQPARDFESMRACLLTGTAVEDMYSLAQCDYIVGPRSTFSMWASFHGETPLYRLTDPHRPVRPEDFVVDHALVDRPPRWPRPYLQEASP